MGAYGGTAEASMSLSNISDLRDLNNDDIVDWNDVLQFSEKWDSNHVPLKEDLGRDGIVDSNDLVYFFGNWPGFPENSSPVLDFIEDKNIIAGSELIFSLTAIDSDEDELVYEALGLPQGATFEEQIFIWTPEQTGTYSITFIVSDYKSLDYRTLQIIVE